MPDPTTKPPSPRPRRRRRLCGLCLGTALLALLVSALVHAVAPPRRHAPAPAPARFSVIIDGGSTGTRAHVFAVGPDGRPDLARSAVMRVSPGLSSFAADPARVGESLRPLIEFAREEIGTAGGATAEAEVRLMATAGLRLLEDRAREAILASCRDVLRAAGFRFEDAWAKVIPGSDEGIYAWVAANYALGRLGGDPNKTVGIIELGGASAQLTFVSDEVLPPELSNNFTFGETTYTLYTNSFLNFGQNAAQDSLREVLRSRGIYLDFNFFVFYSCKNTTSLATPAIMGFEALVASCGVWDMPVRLGDASKTMLAMIIRNSVPDVQGKTKSLKMDTLRGEIIHETRRYLINRMPTSNTYYNYSCMLCMYKYACTIVQNNRSHFCSLVRVST